MSKTKTPALDAVYARINETMSDYSAGELREIYVDTMTPDDLVREQEAEVELLKPESATDDSYTQAERDEAQQLLELATAEALVTTDDLVARLTQMVRYRGIEHVEEALAEAVRQLRKEGAR